MEMQKYANMSIEILRDSYKRNELKKTMRLIVMSFKVDKIYKVALEKYFFHMTTHTLTILWIELFIHVYSWQHINESKQFW